MKIERVELQQLKMPLKFPFETSFGRMAVKDFILVGVCGEGAVGYGESVAMPYPFYNEETTQTVWYMLKQFLIPVLFSRGVTSPEDLSRIFAPIRRNNMAKASLEGAVWDLYCKQKGISLASALGGKKRRSTLG